MRLSRFNYFSYIVTHNIYAPFIIVNFLGLPNITSPPTPLELSVISTCCAGVKLNLVDPNGVRNHFRVKVYRSGVLHPSTSHEGDYLTISGLQAGREYSFRVSVVNSIGMSEANVTLTPLLG